MHLKPDSQIIVQGIKEPNSSLYTAQMKAYGTNVVAGISPGDGGQLVDDIPVFDLVEQALSAVGQVDATIIFVPPYSAIDSAKEAIASGIKQIIIVTGGIPPLDMVSLLRKVETTDTLIIGPNTSGVIIPEKILLGTYNSEFYTHGSVALISNSDTLNYEVAWELTQAGIGQSIVVNLGSDTIIGSDFYQWLEILDKDQHTKVIVLVSHSSYPNEQALAEFIASNVKKPVITYFVGIHTPADKNLRNFKFLKNYYLSTPTNEETTINEKTTAFKHAKISVSKRPSQIPDLVKKALKK
ncbi:MAG TPA: succinyl-CoA synthetase subunit alpha [Oculatellaceae cyanobacterium]|jgi:succinyl-CoA synthetase alpha subunit